MSFQLGSGGVGILPAGGIKPLRHPSKNMKSWSRKRTMVRDLFQAIGLYGRGESLDFSTKNRHLNVSYFTPTSV